MYKEGKLLSNKVINYYKNEHLKIKEKGINKLQSQIINYSSSLAQLKFYYSFSLENTKIFHHQFTCQC
jgi:hypothetical protein